jgi:signal transduction histidine kinase
LKSPLTSIRQIAEILARKRVSTEERKEKYYTMILQQSERLSHLIENILDFSKMEAGQKKFRFEETDPCFVAKKVVRLFQEHLTIHDFHINLSIPNPVKPVWGDTEALEQVLYNLIDNAIKYSGKSKTIDVIVEYSGEAATLMVRDYGIGISKEEQEKIFHQFYRSGEELTRTVKGTGIGLTIVKQIVKAHKGEISLESTPGRGSTFSIKLPVINPESFR